MNSRPTVTLKIATSLDAKIALANGTSQWITSTESRARVHEMRASHDAILVGIGTALADDPLLTARTVPLPDRQPLRIVADSHLRTPVNSRLLRSADIGPVVLAHADTPEVSREWGTNCNLWSVGDGNGRVAPEQLLRRAEAEGISSIFLEGGGTLAASFMDLGLIDRIEWFRAPIIIGGDGLSAIGSLGLRKINPITRWSLNSSEQIGPDILESWVCVTASTQA